MSLVGAAQGASDGDWIYEIRKDQELNPLNEAGVKGYTGPGGIVSIPSTLGGIPVTIVGFESYPNSVFSSVDSVTSVIIPEGVKTIGHWAFNGCTNLESVFLPNSITEIGHAAFENCSKLESVTIPAGVTNIFSFAFNHCSKLTNFIVAPENPVYASNDGILFDKTKSTLITFPAGKSGHFQIPTNVTSIGYAAFATATNLTSVDIPQSVTNIAVWPFAACFGLTNISVSPDNIAYESSEGVLYSKGLFSLITFPAGKTGAFTVPSTVTSIADVAFKKCTGLTYVAIPNTVTNLGYGLFVDCTALVEVSLPNSLTAIPDDIFANCTSLAGVTLPNSITNIGSGSFADCSNMISITIPSAVTSVGFSSFTRSGLQKVYFLGALPTNWISNYDPDIPIMFPPGVSEYLPSNTVILYRPGAAGWASYDFKNQPNQLILPRLKEHFFINTNNSNKFLLRFETVPGIQYSVQKSSALGVWSNIWSTSGDGLDKSFEDQVSDRAFYRVLQH